MNAKISFFNNLLDFRNSSTNRDKIYLIFTTDTTTFDLNLLNSLDIKFYGAIFPKVLFDNQLYSEGVLVLEFESNIKIEFIENMNHVIFDENSFSNAQSIITIQDGFSDFNSSFLESIFEYLELETNIFGGGSGSLIDTNRPTIFKNDGFYKDAAFLVFLEQKIDIAVSQGWDYLEGPFIATKSEGKILKEIDYKNAFEVYAQVIKKDSGKILTEENFYDVVKDYPVGVIRHNSEPIIRDAVSVNDKGELIFVGDIENNSVINIQKGKSQSLINAACEASVEATKNENESIIMFDCASRLDYLRDDYPSQIEMIQECSSTKHIFGVISIGEIANNGSKYINFLNKSCVMGGICL